MKKFYDVGSHSQWIEITKKGLVINYSCTCENIMYRAFKEEDGKTKIIGYCKHLRIIFLRDFELEGKEETVSPGIKKIVALPNQNKPIGWKTNVKFNN